jgi:hypothetical protein
MARAPDFDRKMLLLATQLAHDSDMKGLLLSALDALLQTLNFPEADMATEAMVLIRCAIRLIFKLMTEPGANLYVLVTFKCFWLSPNLFVAALFLSIPWSSISLLVSR